MDSLSSTAETLNIFEEESACLPFSPPPSFRRTLDVPRYLFRVSSSKSAGLTSPDVAQSVSAAESNPASRTCVFGLQRPDVAADMIYKHLDWKRSKMVVDNLVSWASSLLYALMHVFYRRARRAENFEDIFLYVVDTTRFEADTFVGDLDLIRAFTPYDDDLASFESLRRRRHKDFDGSYYFGEFLSQGTLRIADRVSCVNVQDMIDRGLLQLHPRFTEFAQWTRAEAKWARVVIELRQPFYAADTAAASYGGDQSAHAKRRRVASRIGHLFGLGWRAPIAMALLSLAPNQTDAAKVLRDFRRWGPAWDPVDEECFDPATAINPNNTLPEVSEFHYNLNEAYLNFCEASVRSCINEVLKSVDVARGLVARLDSADHANSNGYRNTGRNQLCQLVRALSRLTETFPGSEDGDDAQGGADDSGGNEGV